MPTVKSTVNCTVELIIMLNFIKCNMVFISQQRAGTDLVNRAALPRDGLTVEEVPMLQGLEVSQMENGVSQWRRRRRSGRSTTISLG